MGLNKVCTKTGLPLWVSTKTAHPPTAEAGWEGFFRKEVEGIDLIIIYPLSLSFR